MLGYLEKQEIKKAVATSTEKKRASKLLQDAGVYEKMDAFVYGDEIKESKPDPEIFRVAAEKIGCKPEECLVLEDSEADSRRNRTWRCNYLYSGYCNCAGTSDSESDRDTCRSGESDWVAGST